MIRVKDLKGKELIEYHNTSEAFKGQVGYHGITNITEYSIVHLQRLESNYAWTLKSIFFESYQKHGRLKVHRPRFELGDLVKRPEDSKEYRVTDIGWGLIEEGERKIPLEIYTLHEDNTNCGFVYNVKINDPSDYQKVVPEIPPDMNELDPVTAEIVENVLKRLQEQGAIGPNPFQVEEIVARHINNDYNPKLQDRINQIVSNIRTDIDERLAQQQTTFKEELQKTTENVQSELHAAEPAREIIVKHYFKPDEIKEVTLENQHKKFADLLDLLKLNLPVYIYGPTGSGKTTACKIAADILGIPFYRKVMSGQTTESALKGFVDAGGRFVSTALFNAYKNGGIYLADEIDNGNPNVNTVLKEINDTPECYFPGEGLVTKHEKFRLVANANTLGLGANRQYVGRAPQDRALLNIFVYLEWDYDVDFEAYLAEAEYKAWGGKDERIIRKMIRDFQRIRDIINELKIDHILSPRNLIQASRQLAGGLDAVKIRNTTILRGLPVDSVTRIMERLKQSPGAVDLWAKKDNTFTADLDNLEAPF